MNDINLERNDGMEIDIRRLVRAVVRRFWLVMVSAVIGAAVFLLGTWLLITPTYQSTAMFYVNNRNLSAGDMNRSMSSGDLSTARGLVKSYLVILNTRETLQDVIDYADMNLEAEQLSGMMKAESVDNTEIFRITVTSSDPKQAEQLTNAIAYILPKRISAIMDETSAKVVDAAVAATKPSSPDYKNNTIIGVALGLLLSMGAIVLQELFDVTIRMEEEIASVCSHPVLAAIPDMEENTESRCYNRKKSKTKEGKKTTMVGGDVSVSAAEAYRLLRTKLLYSLGDKKGCRIIGISSALNSEGKSLSAVNLAYSLSQLNQKVLLLDADMRCSTVIGGLPVAKGPGLSDFLTGQNDLNALIQCCGLPEEKQAFSVISSGRIPSNPMELLSSPRMEEFLALLRQYYDYILIDLPPVGVVADALVVSKWTDGFLLVVRQDGCNRLALKNAVRQFAFVDARVLGVVYNGATADGGIFGKDKRSYQKYDHWVQQSYEKTGNESQKEQEKTWEPAI